MDKCLCGLLHLLIGLLTLSVLISKLILLDYAGTLIHTCNLSWWDCSWPIWWNNNNLPRLITILTQVRLLKHLEILLGLLLIPLSYAHFGWHRGHADAHWLRSRWSWRIDACHVIIITDLLALRWLLVEIHIVLLLILYLRLLVWLLYGLNLLWLCDLLLWDHWVWLLNF